MTIGPVGSIRDLWNIDARAARLEARQRQAEQTGSGTESASRTGGYTRSGGAGAWAPWKPSGPVPIDRPTVSPIPVPPGGPVREPHPVPPGRITVSPIPVPPDPVGGDSLTVTPLPPPELPTVPSGPVVPEPPDHPVNGRLTVSPGPVPPEWIAGGGPVDRPVVGPLPPPDDYDAAVLPGRPVTPRPLR